MVAFIVDVPNGFLEPSNRPARADFPVGGTRPNAGFLEKTSAAIIVLLVFLGYYEFGGGDAAP